MTAVLGRAIWLQDNLAAQVIDCWAELREHAAVAARSGRTTSNPRTIEERRFIIASFPWKDADGRPLTELPWEVKVGRKREITAVWPPRDATSINVMVGIIQALNFCTLSFCDGARSSENLDVDDNSVSPEDPERPNARTFKYEPLPGGTYRDWPLHPRAIKALEIQQKIAKVIRPEEGTHLWMLLVDGAEPAGSPLRNATEPIVEAIKKLGLTALSGPKRPHAHRWRHTIARLIALCVAAAPQVLMDLFGHRDLEITLHYILSNPSIAEEVQRIAEEIAYALAEEAIVDVEAGRAGGQAAEPLRSGLNGLKMRRGQEELGAETMAEAIAILTFNGRLWASVREGVLCTKGLGQFGPCTRGSGAPDPGNCDTGCDHRLELARAKADCLRALRGLLRDRDQASTAGADLQVAYFDGQILAQLKRWPDVRNQIMAESPVARAIWDGRRSSHDL
ncbi:hypothetical protein [Mesorhizobium sp. CAU 1741]|uniref:hypothetical protein n=1 Tax=Mesorhizobium sp. CAU 1741 TaxID=3140366 RepID=UPI00325BC74B